MHTNVTMIQFWYIPTATYCSLQLRK